MTGFGTGGGQGAAARLGDLAPARLLRQLRGGRLALRLGPLVWALESSLPALAASLGQHYRAAPLADETAWVDFRLAVRSADRWSREPAAVERHGCLLDGRPLPLPAQDDALAALEAGLDWCVGELCHQYLVLRATALERDGLALLLCGQPGAGHSVLACALQRQGWRLLSDGLSLFDPVSTLLQGLARPVRLRAEALHEPTMRTEQHAGDDRRWRPVDDVAMQRSGEPAWPGWLVQPHWRPGQQAALEPVSSAEGLMWLAASSPNYAVHATAGFEALGSLIDQVGVCRLSYGRLGDALDALATLCATPPCPRRRLS